MATNENEKNTGRVAKLIRMIDRHYKTNQPLHIWGPPGVGKTTAVKDYCKANNLDCIVLIASQLDSTDFNGIPYTIPDPHNPEGRQTKWAKPDFYPRGGKGIFFIDELNLAPPHVQHPCYQLILERRIGDYKLPDGWVPVAAGNRAEDYSGVTELAPPLANRFNHFTLEAPSIKEWTDYITEKHKNNYDYTVLAYLQWHGVLYDKPDLEKDAAYLSPRSAERAGLLVKNIEPLEYKAELLASVIGKAHASRYEGYCRLASKHNIEEIIKNPAKLKDIKELEELYAIMGVLLNRIRDNETANEVIRCIEYLPGEFGYAIMQEAIHTPGFKHTPETMKITRRYLAKELDEKTSKA